MVQETCLWSLYFLGPYSTFLLKWKSIIWIYLNSLYSCMSSHLPVTAKWLDWAVGAGCSVLMIRGLSCCQTIDKWWNFCDSVGISNLHGEWVLELKFLWSSEIHMRFLDFTLGVRMGGVGVKARWAILCCEPSWGPEDFHRGDVLYGPLV